MLVSIIVPVYNTEKFIAETLQSALNQTYQDIEIIVIDDASTDSSKEIIQDFQKQYPEKIRTIFHTENTGESIGRREGFEMSQGDYIYFLDADDKIYPNAIERFIAGTKKTYANILIGNRDRINQKGEKLDDTSKKWQQMLIKNIQTTLLMHSPFTPGNLFIAKKILSSSDFESSIRYGEDWLMFVRLAQRSLFFAIGGDPVYSYRHHSEQQTRSKVPFSERARVIGMIYQEPEIQRKYRYIPSHIYKSMAYIRYWLWSVSLQYPLLRKIYLLLSR